MNGEQRLRQAIRKISKPPWLEDRIRCLKEQRNLLIQQKGQLELQKIMHGIDTPPTIFFSLEQVAEEITRVEQELEVLFDGWETQLRKADRIQT